MKIFQLFDGLGRRTFLLLLLGFLAIQAVGLMGIYSGYLVLQHRAAVRFRVANQVIKLAALSREVSSKDLRRLVAGINSPSFKATLARAPVTDSEPINSPKAANIRKAVKEVAHHPNSQLALSLPNGLWLNIQARKLRTRSLLVVVYIIAALFMLLGSIFLCLWAVNRLARPLRHISQAAQRLTQDVNADPITEKSPKDLQNVSQTFNHMQRKIKQLLHDRTRMLAAISHDLRTPLTRIQLRMSFLQKNDVLAKIAQDLAEMQTMLTSTLAFARDDFLREPVESFDLIALLESLCDDMMDLGFPVSYDIQAQHLTFQGRLLALKRAFSNLLDNAMKYGKCAKLTCCVHASRAEIIIEDKGPGIPETQLEKVFEPFYRVDDSRSPEKGGTGLGLAVAQEIIHAHDGRVVLKNKADKGLQVQVRLSRETLS